MQAALETALFGALERAENKLLQLPPDRKECALESFLHIPIDQNPTAVNELRTIVALLDCEQQNSNRNSYAAPLYDKYREIYAENFDHSLSIGGSLVESIRANVARRRERGKGLAASTHETPILERLKMEDLRSLTLPPSDDGGLAALTKALGEQMITTTTATTLSPHFSAKRPSNSVINRQDNYSGRVSPPSKRMAESKDSAVMADEEEEDDSIPQIKNDFVTAKHQLNVDAAKKSGGRPMNNGSSSATAAAAPARKTLGSNRRRGFVPPIKNRDTDGGGGDDLVKEVSKRVFGGSSKEGDQQRQDAEMAEVDERLKNIDPKMIETIQNEIMDNAPKIGWDDIAGLKHAKKSIKEMVIWPMQRPDIFTGLRRAPKGLLLFGPPGTGKTMIGKCIASTAGCTFFSISASSLTSKWVGEGEKMVRALFAVARVHQPAVIFIDEIDSLLTQRTDGEFEASRRIKTEFLIQFDGAHIQNPDEDRILVIGATNRPQELDEAARRRLIKRFYIPLPDPEARQYIVRTLLSKQTHRLSEEETAKVGQRTKGYSGSDMDGLCREAALGPIREIQDISVIPLDSVRPIEFKDFEYALTQVRASVSDKDLDLYQQWNQDYGSLPDCFERER